ncbi:hypothetical protein DPMN_104447 [Dreissena polymorpha]|uniref:Uncharacterized protein n=1 Tax=Dreissena polymorpha TaxID=45954 RepID=A0A9D4K025_DREPO|nr:hypothetical protein DPMN_104447 [Dreissena polymorpha]
MLYCQIIVLLLCAYAVTCSEGQDGVQNEASISISSYIEIPITTPPLPENGITSNTPSVFGASSSSASLLLTTVPEDPVLPNSTSTIEVNSKDVSTASLADSTQSGDASINLASDQSSVTPIKLLPESSSIALFTSSISETSIIDSTIQTTSDLNPIHTSIETPSVSTTDSIITTVDVSTSFTTVLSIAVSAESTSSVLADITFPIETSTSYSPASSTVEQVTPEQSLTSTSETSPIINSSQSFETMTSLISLLSSTIDSTETVVSTDMTQPGTTISSSKVGTVTTIVKPEFETNSETTKTNASEVPTSTTGISPTSNTNIETTHSITQSTIVSTFSTLLENAAVNTPITSSTEDATNTSHQTNNASGTFDYKILLKFEGECGSLKTDEEFRTNIFNTISSMFHTLYNISKEEINYYRLSCSPHELVIIIRDADQQTVDAIVQTLVNYSASYFDANLFSLSDAHILGLHSETDADIGFLETELEFTDILIISISSFLFFVLLLMCIVMVCRECVRRKRGQSFTLTEVPHVNTKLADFTLTKIPRLKVIYEKDGVTEVSAPHTSKFLDELKHAGCQSGWSTKDGVTRENRQSINAEDILVRMSDWRDGVVFGVTSRHKAMYPENTASPVSDDVNRNLIALSNSNPSNGGVANPGFLSDNFTANNDIEKDDELEMTL